MFVVQADSVLAKWNRFRFATVFTKALSLLMLSLLMANESLMKWVLLFFLETSYPE